MPPVRRARWERFEHAESARAMVIGYWLVRLGLEGTEVPGESPAADWQRGPAGKPVSVGHTEQFGLAHTGSLQVCAVADFPIGVDAERISIEVDEATHVVMNDDEIRHIKHAPDPVDEGTRMWTAKEALIKRDGQRLADSMRPEFDLGNPLVSATVVSKRMLGHWISIATHEPDSVIAARSALETPTIIPVTSLAARFASG